MREESAVVQEDGVPVVRGGRREPEPDEARQEARPREDPLRKRAEADLLVDEKEENQQKGGAGRLDEQRELVNRHQCLYREALILGILLAGPSDEGATIRNRDRIAVIAPTPALARSAAAFLAGRLEGQLHPFALADYLASPRAPERVVLCPSGRSLASDVDFLASARERVLWGAPDETLSGAIEGLRGSPPPAPAGGSPRRVRPVRGGKDQTAAALLLEGTVTSARARALISQDARLWIVENARRVRVSPALMERLRRQGVRWAALEPVSLVALLASPRLARVRSRWGRLLPRATPVWIRANK